MKTTLSDLNITKYHDYRDFLKDLFTEKRLANKKMSHEYVARKLETTKSYLALLTGKKRHSSPEKIWKIAKFFNLSTFDRKYFLFLFMENTTKEREIKSYYQQVLEGFRDRDLLHSRIQGVHRTTDGALFPNSPSKTRIIYKSWLHTSVVCLTRLDDFRNDPKWMSERLGGGIAKKELLQVVADLIQAGVLIEKAGRLSAETFSYLEMAPEDPEQYKDLQDFILRAVEATNDVDKHRSFCFQGMGLALNSENCRKVVDLYQELFQKLDAIEKAPQKREWVLMISNNVFNVTPRPSKPKADALT